MKILKINSFGQKNEKSSSGQPSFNAKIDTVNPLAKRFLLNLDKNFGDVFNGTSEEFKAIKFNELPVNISLIKFRESPNSVFINARLDDTTQGFGYSEFLMKSVGSKNKNPITEFMLKVRKAVDNIASSPTYLSKKMDIAVEKINNSKNGGSQIRLEESVSNPENYSDVKELLFPLGKAFTDGLAKKADKVSKINIDGRPLLITVKRNWDNDAILIFTYFQRSSFINGSYSCFQIRKPNGDVNDIKGFIKCIRQSVKNLEAKEKRDAAKALKE